MSNEQNKIDAKVHPVDTLVTNNSDGTRLDYVDPEAPTYEGFDKTTLVSGYMAGRAFNHLCKMIGGR